VIFAVLDLRVADVVLKRRFKLLSFYNNRKTDRQRDMLRRNFSSGKQICL